MSQILFLFTVQKHCNKISILTSLLFSPTVEVLFWNTKFCQGVACVERSIQHISNTNICQVSWNGCWRSPRPWCCCSQQQRSCPRYSSAPVVMVTASGKFQPMTSKYNHCFQLFAVLWWPVNFSWLVNLEYCASPFSGTRLHDMSPIIRLLYQMYHACGCNITLCTLHVWFAPQHLHSLYWEGKIQLVFIAKWRRMLPENFIKPCLHMETFVAWCCQMEQWSWALLPHICHSNRERRQDMIGQGPAYNLPCLLARARIYDSMITLFDTVIILIDWNMVLSDSGICLTSSDDDCLYWSLFCFSISLLFYLLIGSSDTLHGYLHTTTQLCTKTKNNVLDTVRSFNAVKHELDKPLHTVYTVYSQNIYLRWSYSQH